MSIWVLVPKVASDSGSNVSFSLYKSLQDLCEESSQINRTDVIICLSLPSSQLSGRIQKSVAMWPAEGAYVL